MPDDLPVMTPDGKMRICDPYVGEFGTEAPGVHASRGGIRFLLAVQDGWHAVDLGAAKPRCEEHAWAVCGALVSVVMVAWGNPQPYEAADPRVQGNPCHACAWIVAAQTGTLDAALARLTDPVAHEAGAGFLGERVVSGSRRDPALMQLLAAVSDHAPVPLVSEPCSEGECEHEGGCPETLACKACSLQAGPWAGEWEGRYRAECTIAAPCAPLLALAEAAKRERGLGND